MMKRIQWLISAVALAAACGDGGGNTSPDSGTSVTPPVDSGTPANDGSAQPDSLPTPPEDAAVPQDAPTPPVDMPATSVECWRQLCGSVRIVVVDGRDSYASIPAVIDCPPDGMNQIGIPHLHCVATCNGDVCNCSPEDSIPGMTAIVTNSRAMGASCSDTFAVSNMLNGSIMPPTNGDVVSILRRHD